VPFLSSIFSDTLQLFYPHICTGCGSDLLQKDHLLCIACLTKLPHTGFARFAANPIEKYFWGRLHVTAAHSEFYFSKGELVQHLIHRLKYKNDTAIGACMGAILADTLLKSGRFSAIDGLVPLPLYPDKERKRGYNQATVICNGMSPVMQVPVIDHIVIRQRFTETQTRKHRTERWENVDQSFAVANSTSLQGKHLLLVDDVVTTGATLEACGSRILNIPGTRLSIATLAHAPK